MIVKQGRFYLKHNTLSEDAPIAIIFKVGSFFIFGAIAEFLLSSLSSLANSTNCTFDTDESQSAY